MKLKTVTREQLYVQVWSKPILKLSKEYGISDVGLAKICKRMNIPRPPRGYWAKLEAGKSVTREPLPELPENGINETVISQSSIQYYASDLSKEAKEVVDRCTDEVVVLDQLDSPHRLIKHAKSSLKSSKHSDFLVPKNQNCLSVRVTQETLHRALCVFDALIKALDAKGYKVAVKKKNDATITVTKIFEEELEISLTEKFDRKLHEPTESELRKKKKYPWTSIPKYDYFPSGKLSLKIENPGWFGLRQTWSDAKTQRMEDMLGKFIEGLVIVADTKHKDRLKREEEKRLREIERQRRNAIKQRYEDEKKRIEVFELEFNAWLKADQIRQYLGAYEKKLKSKELKKDQLLKYQNWLKWAHQYANHLDPLSRDVMPAIKEYEELDWGFYY